MCVPPYRLSDFRPAAIVSRGSCATGNAVAPEGQMARVPAKTRRAFDARAFLESAGLGQRVVAYGRGDIIFSQGDPWRSFRTPDAKRSSAH